MVKFVGGFSPSSNAYKSYKNHTIAREGQWRIPRAYGSVKKEVKLDIREYNYCGGSYGGFQLPAWLQWAQFGMNFINQWIPQPKAPQDTNPFAQNPLQAQLDDLNKKVEELTAENEKLKNKDKVEDPKKETDPVDINANVNLSTEEVIDTIPGQSTVTETTVKVNNTARTVRPGINEGYNWQSLYDAYGVPRDKQDAFRAEFRKQVTGGAKGIGVGEQHYPKEFKVGNDTFKFDLNNYKPHQYPTDANFKDKAVKTQRGTETQQGVATEQRSWKGSATATWKDKDGTPQSKTVTVSGQASKDAAIAKLKADIKGQVPADAKIKFDTKEK